ncbi:hypothetical protein FRC01_008754 [Tulasnella sp. 417]|nr:hypothetical protein FRC01_008754 [Tulasnella sp. 417]
MVAHPRLKASRFANPVVLWRTGALLVASGIITGAFGAHAIRKRVAPEKLVAWNSASHYALLVLGTPRHSAVP